MSLYVSVRVSNGEEPHAGEHRDRHLRSGSRDRSAALTSNHALLPAGGRPGRRGSAARRPGPGVCVNTGGVCRHCAQSGGSATLCLNICHRFSSIHRIRSRVFFFAPNAVKTTNEIHFRYIWGESQTRVSQKPKQCVNDEEISQRQIPQRNTV